MKYKILKTEYEYKIALDKFDELFDSKPGTVKGDEAEFLALLIENYEEENFPIDTPDPLEAIKFRMQQMGLKQKDLASILGYKSRVSEIFSKKRKRSLKMIRVLHAKLAIPFEVLINESTAKRLFIQF
ncbi:MAG: transcriptional regulator [Bacteroidetes bacterium]|nr:transcriptional regulator [Bacteroidota bacterium]